MPAQFFCKKTLQHRSSDESYSFDLTYIDGDESINVGNVTLFMNNSVIQKQLSNLKRSTGRLMNLVSELLNIRKLETGNINLHVSKNDIVFFVHEIFLASSQHAIANNIDYKFNKPEKKIYVWFDKIQFEKTIYDRHEQRRHDIERPILPP